MSCDICPECRNRLLDEVDCHLCDYGMSDGDMDVICKVVLLLGDRALIMLRSPSEKYGRRWDLPGGHIRVGEGCVSGLLREVEEETGLRLEKPVRKLYTDGREHYYVSEMPDDPIVLSHEHMEYAFVSLNGIPDNIADKFVRAIKKALGYFSN